MTRLESCGAAVGVTDDIDAEARNAKRPTCADEFRRSSSARNDIAANAFVTPANGGILANGATVSPQASFTNVG